jgi:hypothetical protein
MQRFFHYLKVVGAQSSISLDLLPPEPGFIVFLATITPTASPSLRASLASEECVEHSRVSPPIGHNMI